MQLEIGKTYITRDNREVFVKSIYTKDTYNCVLDNKDNTYWYSNGRYWLDGHESDLDIIKEKTMEQSKTFFNATVFSEELQKSTNICAGARADIAAAVAKALGQEPKALITKKDVQHLAKLKINNDVYRFIQVSYTANLFVLLDVGNSGRRWDDARTPKEWEDYFKGDSHIKNYKVKLY